MSTNITRGTSNFINNAFPLFIIEVTKNHEKKMFSLYLIQSKLLHIIYKYNKGYT